MVHTRAEEQRARSAAFDLQQDTTLPPSLQIGRDPRQRQRPSAVSTIRSPNRHVTKSPTKSSPDSDVTFSSLEAYNRRPSLNSVDSADNFKAPIPDCPIDLANEIHPIFQRRNCHGEARQRYEVLKFAFQLASRFLQTDSLLGFWWTLMCSDVEEIKDPWYTAPAGARSWQFLDTPTELAAAEIFHVKYTLNGLSDKVRLTVVPGGRRNGRDGDSFCAFRRQNGHPRIFLSREVFRGFRDAVHRNDGPRFLVNSFRLAIALCHELAHAVMQTERHSQTYYFPDNIASEPGFEFERRVLGGSLVEFNVHPQRLRMTKWPCPTLVGCYMTNGMPFGLREKPDPAEVYATDVGRVPFADVARFFLERFWEKVRVQGTSATQIRFRPLGPEEWHPLPEEMEVALKGQKGLRLSKFKERREGKWFRDEGGDCHDMDAVEALRRRRSSSEAGSRRSSGGREKKKGKDEKRTLLGDFLRRKWTRDRKRRKRSGSSAGKGKGKGKGRKGSE